jgi:hypothetical protein
MTLPGHPFTLVITRGDFPTVDGDDWESANFSF